MIGLRFPATVTRTSAVAFLHKELQGHHSRFASQSET
jgi:hypothetical protein